MPRIVLDYSGQAGLPDSVTWCWLYF